MLLVPRMRCACKSGCCFLAAWWAGAQVLGLYCVVCLIMSSLFILLLESLLHGGNWTTLSISQREEMSMDRRGILVEFGSFGCASPLQNCVICCSFWWEEKRNRTGLGWMMKMRMRQVHSWTGSESSSVKILVTSRTEHSVILRSDLVAIRIRLLPPMSCSQLFFSLCCQPRPKRGLLYETRGSCRRLRP